jgi:hypothetical protein
VLHQNLQELSDFQPVDENYAVINPTALVKDDTGYILAGFNSTDDSMRVVYCKYDLQFNNLWTHSLPVSQLASTCTKTLPTTDHGYIFGQTGDFNASFVKFNADGVMQYNHSLPMGSGVFRIYDIIEGTNCFYFLAYVPQLNGLYQLDIFRLNADFTYSSDFLGSYESDLIPEITGFHAPKVHISKLADGGYMVLAPLYSGQLHRFDANMNLLWHRNLFSDNSNHVAYKIGYGDQPFVELPNGDFLFCATKETEEVCLVRTNNQGIVATEDDAQPVPAHVKAFKAYPNPFNPLVHFDLQVPAKNHMQYKIFNLKGQLVQTLDATSKQTTWKPNNLASGIYFVRLMDNSRVLHTQKIVMLK